ncbi:MAG: PQQ-like beta-propeller repeat protein, partial [Myxococcales bacterium]|nr:PQQ-like beta-propeller repeat protein [Myxococcales bacterium]
LVATRGQEIFVQSGRDLLRIDEHSHSRKIPLPAITQATIHATETTIFVAGRLGSEWVVSSLERSTLTSRWSRKLPIAEGDHAIWLTPQSAEVVTLAISGLRTRIYGITAGTGVTRWLYRLPELQGRQVILGRPVVAKNGALIVAAESIYALSAEGHLLWRSAPFGVRLVATCANGTIFASDGHHLWELDGAGAIRTVYRSFEHGRDHFSQLVVGNGEVVLRGVSEIRVFRISGITAARTPVAFARDPL